MSIYIVHPADGNSTISSQTIEELIKLNNFLLKFNDESPVIEQNHYAGIGHYKEFADKNLLKSFFELNNSKLNFDSLVNKMDDFIFDHFFEVSCITKPEIKEALKQGMEETSKQGSEIFKYILGKELPGEIAKHILDYINPREALAVEAIQKLELAGALPFFGCDEIEG